jgi:hypothetical protein
MLALFCIFTAAVAAILLGITWAGRGTVGGEDPLCARCRYCVRGLAGTICPECGGELRDVGVLTPGSVAPISVPKRVLIWTLATPLVALGLYGLLRPYSIPQWQLTMQRRVIFAQSSYCFVTITANTSGKQLVFGNRPNRSPAAAELMFLSYNNRHMQVNLADKTYRRTDQAGKVITGPFDAKAIETWLNDDGFTDPRVAERASDIANAVKEIGTPEGNGFTLFPPDHDTRGAATGIAHPTFTTSVVQPNDLTRASGYAFGPLVWLAGLPLILRRRQQSSSRRTGVPPIWNSPAATAPAPH